MLFDKYKMKFRKVSDNIHEEAPQYSITYKNNPEDAGKISHEIISAFVGDNDLIIEINSDMRGLGTGRTNTVTEFLDKTSAFDLLYVMRNVPSERGRTIFGFSLLNKKKKVADEALIYIPNNVWRHPSFRDNLPLNGAKYCITDGTVDVSEKLEEISKMDKSERADIFKVLLFDLAICSQMGISSKHLSMDDIKGMLGS